MSLYLLSALGLPVMAIVFFAVLEAAFSKSGLWATLSGTGIDLCKVSIGIAGAVFLDLHLQEGGTFAAFVLLLELIVSAMAMLIDNRAEDMGMTLQYQKACGILACGIVSVVIPAVFIVLNGAKHGS